MRIIATPFYIRAHRTRCVSNAVFTRSGRILGALLVSTLVSSSALLAQRKSTPMNPGLSVPSKKPDLGKFPAGWSLRKDSVTTRGRADSTTLLVTNEGWQVQSGPSALVLAPKHTASGSFVVASVLYLAQAKSHALPGYGVFFGGRYLGTPNARYTEFLLRSDGKYCLRRHDGAKLTVIKDWSTAGGIQAHDGRYDTVVGNRIRIAVDQRIVQVVVNRVVVTSMLREQALPEGEFGVRVGADQDVTIGSIEIEKVGASQEIPPFRLTPKASSKPSSKALPPQPAGKSAGVPAGARAG